MMDRKYLFDLSSKISETELCAERAITVLGDVLEEYDFYGNSPSKEQEKKIVYDARRMFDFLNIAFDYVSKTRKELIELETEINEKWTHIKVEQEQIA